MSGRESSRVDLASGPDAIAMSDSRAGSVHSVEVVTCFRVTQGVEEIFEQPQRLGYRRQGILNYGWHGQSRRESITEGSDIDRPMATVISGAVKYTCGKVHLMIVHKNQPFTRRLRFALQGLGAAWRSERNFRIQLALLAAVVVVLVAMGLEPLWWALVLLTSGSVLAAELFNTALEHLADHLHPQTHAQIQIVKDCAAAAVLVAAGAAVAVGVALIVHLAHRH